MPTIRELLATQPPSAVNARQLLRAIAEHAAWYVPMLAFPDRDTFGSVVLPADGRLGSVPNELWLFSDRAAVDRAPQQLGFGTLSGLEVCASLKPACETVQLDPGSPEFLTIRTPDVVRSQLAQFALAVPVERALEASGHAALRALDHRFMVVLDRGMPVSVEIKDRAGHAILVFTAADAVDGLFERMPPEDHANLAVSSFSARELFRNIGQASIDAMAINPFGPCASVVVAGEELAELVQLANA